MLFLSATFALSASLGAYPLLAFEARQYEQRKVLLAYDCGAWDNRQNCMPWEQGVSAEGPYVLPDSSRRRYVGDAQVLSDALARLRPDEVWLLSGGGHVSAGLGMARVLRQYGALVRVPSAATLQASTGAVRFDGGGFCASSCTITFMGGALRQVDRGAQFVLHSASSFLNTIPEWVPPQLGKHGFRWFADSIQASQCNNAFEVVRLFQNTLLAPRRARGAALESERPPALASTCATATWYTEDQRDWDETILKVEGLISFQDTGMRMERAAMRQALAYWASRAPSHGPLFDDALRMIEAMYTARITALVPLSEAELLALGYVTEFVAMPGARN
jgi:hypothetical protein